MEPLRIRTINPVINADPFSKVDYHIIAELQQFDIIAQNYHVVYYKEIPNALIAEDVRPANGDNMLEQVYYFPNLIMEASEINHMLGTVLAVDFYANGGAILENIQSAMHEIFRLKVGSDGRYGLTADKWEKMHNNVLESQLNKIEIVDPINNQVITSSDIIIKTLIENAFNLSKVEFYEGANLLGSNTEYPFDEFTWVSAPVGTYTITAKLFDANIEVRTSEPVIIEVQG